MRRQNENDLITEYAAALQNLITTREFGGIQEELVRDVFISGLTQNWSRIREKLLRGVGIRLQKALDITKSFEAAK